MKIGRRLRVYLVGVLMGLIASYFMLGPRSCEWLPGNRVKSFIAENQIRISDSTLCRMECFGLGKEDVYNLLNYGEVSFSESQTSGFRKEYVVQYDELKVSFLVDMTDSLSEVIQFHGYDTRCACSDFSNESKQVLYEPNDMILERLRKNGFSLTSSNECQFNCVGIDSLFASNVLQNGTVVHERSFPRRDPNPVYTIKFNLNLTDTLYFLVEEGFKTRILEITEKDGTSSCDCN